MCGITGIIDAAATGTMLQSSMAMLAHRGPDGQGIYTDTPLLLGHVRLAIQDTTARAAQPMVSANERFVLVYNGEWYNHRETREALEKEGVLFRSSSDTETLLNAYACYGEAVLQQMRGIFAFAVYDKQERKLFLARDHSGVKPLYYYSKDNRFAFASEIKALLPFDIDRSLNADAFYQTLLLQWHLEDHTGFRHVRRLLPGHCITVYTDNPDNIQLKKWYRPEPVSVPHKPEAVWKEELEHLLQSSVQMQLLSDRPLGFYLSGGLDSSLLVSMAKQYSSGRPQPCFTIDTRNDFRKEGFTEDLPFARKVARALNAELHVIPASADMVQDLDAMIWQLDEAQGDLAPLLSGRIAAAAREAGIPVLIGGTGADDIFSGYRRHQALAYEGLINMMPAGFRTGLKHTVQRLPSQQLTRRLKKLTGLLDLHPVQRMSSYYFWSEPLTAYYLFSDEGRERVDRRLTEGFFERLDKEIPGELHPLNRMLYYEQHGFLPNHNLNYTDKMAMAYGVEVRVPYLDQRLVEWSRTLPATLKMKGTVTKYLLRRMAAAYLPADVIYRKKTGFGVPLRQWLKEDSSFRRSAAERLHEGVLHQSGLFDQEAIQRLWKDTVTGQRDSSYTVLSLMAIESWLRQFAP